MATIPLAKGGSIRTFSQAPAGFNPLSASDRELAVFGFPRRPTENPHLLARWQKALSRPVYLIQPKFRVGAGNKIISTGKIENATLVQVKYTGS